MFDCYRQHVDQWMFTQCTYSSLFQPAIRSVVVDMKSTWVSPDTFKRSCKKWHAVLLDRFDFSIKFFLANVTQALKTGNLCIKIWHWDLQWSLLVSLDSSRSKQVPGSLSLTSHNFLSVLIDYDGIRTNLLRRILKTNFHILNLMCCQLPYQTLLNR